MKRVMKRVLILVAVLLPVLLCGNTWAVEGEAIQELQTDVLSTKSKADKNAAAIESMKGGLPALEDRVSIIETRMDSGEFQGAQGPAGPAGADGAIGAQGPAGLAGADGAVGAQGPAGLAGADGAVGPQGPQGEQGLQGECDCPITQEQLDEIYERLEYIEDNALISRFVDMSNGTVKDNESGLIWLKDASCRELAGTHDGGMANWQTAMDAADVLAAGTCGLTDGSSASDWRLPTKGEWEAFVDTKYSGPALSNAAGTAKWTEGNAFIGVQPYYYWSSTESGDDGAWDMAISNGVIRSDLNKGNPLAVWPVRSDN